MSSKTIVITGPTSGIGRVTALALARKGYRLVLLARNPEKASALQQEIGSDAAADFIQMDLADLDSVRNAAAIIRGRYPKIDVLINNAGVIVDEKRYSADGVELTFAVNHLGHFLLTTALTDLLKAAGNARIINVSSGAHRFAKFRPEELADPSGYLHIIAYANAKLCNILFSNELAERYREWGISSNALHPGTVASSFGDASGGVVRWFFKIGRPFFKTEQQGAATSIYLADSPEAEGVTGGYLENSRPARRSAAARDKKLALQLWDLSEDLVKRFRN